MISRGVEAGDQQQAVEAVVLDLAAPGGERRPP